MSMNLIVPATLSTKGSTSFVLMSARSLKNLHMMPSQLHAYGNPDDLRRPASGGVAFIGLRWKDDSVSSLFTDSNSFEVILVQMITYGSMDARPAKRSKGRFHSARFDGNSSFSKFHVMRARLHHDWVVQFSFDNRVLASATSRRVIRYYLLSGREIYTERTAKTLQGGPPKPTAKKISC